MPTEGLGPIYMVSNRKWWAWPEVPSPEWLWAPVEKWEELTSFPAGPNQFPWRRWA